jgi:CBS domain-containing protein
LIRQGKQTVGVVELTDICRLIAEAPRVSFARLLEEKRGFEVLEKRTCAEALNGAKYHLDNTALVTDVIHLFGKLGLRRLLLTGNQTGLVTQTALMQHLMENLPRENTLRMCSAGAIGWIENRIFAVESKTPAGLVFASMSQHQVSGVALVKGDTVLGEVGIQHLDRLSLNDQKLLDLPIKTYLADSLAQSTPVSCTASISVYDLMKLFVQTKTHRVFVVKKSPLSSHLIGIATLTGFFRVLAGLSATMTAAADAPLNKEFEKVVESKK